MSRLAAYDPPRMPSSWPGLFADVDRADLSSRRLVAAQAEFEAWAGHAEECAFVEAHRIAVHRADELHARTAVRVAVDARRLSAGKSRQASPRSIGLELGASRVHLYSVRELGTAPCVHLGIQRAATTSRSPVFTTLPGALLVRRPDDGFDALCLPVPTDGRDCPRTTIDALLLRAFELLVAAHRSTLT